MVILYISSKHIGQSRNKIREYYFFYVFTINYKWWEMIITSDNVDIIKISKYNYKIILNIIITKLYLE